MDELYDRALLFMESTVHSLARRVPPPQRVPFLDSFVFRYVEKTVFQALVQKLARLVSTLQAARLLMNHGFVQEQGALQRMMDELKEDISFLAYAVIFNEVTPLHKLYLDAFYQEEFDAETALDSSQKRPMVRREKVRAYLARADESALNPSRQIEALRTIAKAYSGYVHAASPHIMDMYGGSPPMFFMRGMRGTERHDEHRADLWNYFYRSIVAFATTAKAFGDDDLFTKIALYAKDFARKADKDYAPSAS
jgi:hypothetical protein